MTGILPGLSKLAVAPRISVALETLDRHPLHDGDAIVEQRMATDFIRVIERKDARVDALAVIDGLNYSNARMVALTIYVRAK